MIYPFSEAVLEAPRKLSDLSRSTRVVRGGTGLQLMLSDSEGHTISTPRYYDLSQRWILAGPGDCYSPRFRVS